MTSRFELEWRGGAAEKHFRKLRPMDPEIPWGTLDPRKFPPVLVDRARISWTAIARSEYRAAAAFADVISAMLAAKAPLDLIGMAGDFIADELFHSELASRLAMEIGGGVGIQTDFDRLGVTPASSDTSARERANELVLRVACISETLSGAMAVETMREVEHPLVLQIMERIARDEAKHTRLGWLYLEWATEEMSDEERLRLGEVGKKELKMLSPLWMQRTSVVVDGVTTEGY
ncbi:MAG: ferritin-like domain-containing protein, partial [Polyangiaceae bacterium]